MHKIFMNTKKIGARRELLVLNKLKKEGFVDVFRTHTIKIGKFYKGLDFADLFDLVVVKDHLWKFISVKSNSDKKHEEEIKKFVEKHYPFNASFEFWIYKKRKGFKIKKL
jgi:hypothetical protein